MPNQVPLGDRLDFAQLCEVTVRKAVIAGIGICVISGGVHASELDYESVRACIADALAGVDIEERWEYRLFYGPEGEIVRLVQADGIRLPSSPTTRHLHRTHWEVFTICAPVNPDPEMLAGETVVTIDGSSVSVAVTSIFELELVETDNSKIELSRRERRRVQRYLMFLGYNPGTPDGVFGNGTRAAIAAWQAAEGFPETGQIDERQFKHLESEAAGLYADWVQEMATK